MSRKLDVPALITCLNEGVSARPWLISFPTSRVAQGTGPAPRDKQGAWLNCLNYNSDREGHMYAFMNPNFSLHVRTPPVNFDSLLSLRLPAAPATALSPSFLPAIQPLQATDTARAQVVFLTHPQDREIVGGRAVAVGGCGHA